MSRFLAPVYAVGVPVSIFFFMDHQNNYYNGKWTENFGHYRSSTQAYIQIGLILGPMFSWPLSVPYMLVRDRT